MFMPSRGGTRGGKDQFNWEQVKGDKYREFYLGQTLVCKPVWWTDAIKKKGQGNVQASIQAEIEAQKRQEQELLKEKLGLAPEKKRGSGKVLEKHELDELTKRGNIEHDEYTTPTHRDFMPEGVQTASSSNPFEKGTMVHVDDDEEDKPRHAADEEEDYNDKKKRDKKDKKDKKDRKKDKKDKKHKKDKKDKKDKKEKRRHDKDKHRDDRYKEDKDRERRHERKRHDREEREGARDRRRYDH